MGELGKTSRGIKIYREMSPNAYKCFFSSTDHLEAGNLHRNEFERLEAKGRNKEAAIQAKLSDEHFFLSLQTVEE